MDELLKILFGREPSGMGAFPIPQNPVTVEEIMPGQMPSVTNVTPSVTPAEQSRFRMPDFSGINLPELSMPNLRMPDLSGLRMPEFNLPMPGVPEYMQGLIANPEEAQKRAQQAGLMSAAMALLESSGPSPQRTSLGQAIGRGAGAYQQGAQGSFDQILQGLLIKSKLKPEAEKLTGEYANLANLIYGTSDPAKLPAGAVDKIISQVNTKASLVGGGGVGTIPPGFELRKDPATGALSMAPIPGGPAEIEAMEQADKAKGRKTQQARAGGTVVQDLQRALNIVQTNPKATGRSAAAIALLPEVVRAETDYQAAQGMVQSALSNVGLDTLQQMRENSPTGGALGQVPIQQQQRLEQVLGSLDLSQRKEVVEDNIKRVINIYMDSIHGFKEQVEDAYSRGEITDEQRKAYGFRHNLSFDELGNPVKKRSLSDIFKGSK
jgi:hypothetical protein